jgi:hypothetical protein
MARILTLLTIDLTWPTRWVVNVRVPILSGSHKFCTRQHGTPGHSIIQQTGQRMDLSPLCIALETRKLLYLPTFFVIGYILTKIGVVMDNMGITSLVGKEIRCKEPWTPGAVVNGVENAVNSRGKPRMRPVNARLSRGYLKILVDVSQG